MSTASPSTRRRVVIDTDIGIDDAVALLLALLDPSIDVIALTCVAGNVHIDEVVKNAGRILELVKMPHIPFYRGASRSLLAPWRPPDYKGHGDDGLGDTQLSISSLVEKEEHAVSALHRIFREDPDVYLITLGPLTNIALAIAMDPTFNIKKGHFYMMGGSHFSQGNCAYAAEFNVNADPEAAQMCFEKFSITMLSWEMTLKTAMPWEWYDEVIKSKKNAVVDFIEQITRKYEGMTRGNPYRQFNMCDVVAVAIFLDDSLITERTLVHGFVELSGTHTRGATVFDWYHHFGREPNITIPLAIDVKGYHDLCRRILLSEKTTHASSQ